MIQALFATSTIGFYNVSEGSPWLGALDIFEKGHCRVFIPTTKAQKLKKKKGIISAEGVIAILPDDLQRQGFRATGINGIPLGLG